MKLYNANLSPFAARCRIQIYAKGLSVECVEPPGGLGSDEWRRLNPIGKVPALNADGTVVPESEVICEYLEDAHPEPALRPGNALDRARMRFISRFIDLYLMPPMTTLFGQVNPKTRDAKLVGEKQAEIAMRLDQLEPFLDGRSFAIGDGLTLADCALAPVIFFLVRMAPMFGGGDAFAMHPRLAVAWRTQQAHPAVTRVLEEMSTALAELLALE